MFTDLPAGAATGGDATCGIAGAAGAAGIGIPEIGAAGGVAPGTAPTFEGIDIIRVYSLGPCAPLAGAADGFTENACVAPPPYAFGGADGVTGTCGAASLNPPVPNMRV